MGAECSVRVGQDACRVGAKELEVEQIQAVFGHTRSFPLERESLILATSVDSDSDTFGRRTEMRERAHGRDRGEG